MSDTTQALMRETVVSCPLCGCICRVLRDLLARHAGFEPSVDARALPCRAGGRTVEEAQEMALREAEELDALRMRAHP